MSWIVAIEAARTNKQNRALQKARKNRLKENINGLIKMSKTPKTLADRFTNRTETEVVKSINKVRDLYSRESKRRLIYFTLTIAAFITISGLLTVTF